MELVKNNKNRSQRLRTKLIRGLGLFALATALYSGDRAEYRGDVWIGPETLQRAEQPSRGRSFNANNSNQIRIATYNVKRGLIDRDGVVETARSLGADVLGLTEAGGMAREIARGDFNILYGGTGNTLLTKYEVIDSFSQSLPGRPNKPRRSALFAKLDIGDFDQWFVLTHLDHNEWPSSSESSRLRQIEVIEKTIAEQLDGEPILIGDLNIMPGGEAHDRLDANYDDAFEMLGIGHIGTFKGRPGMRRLDYIMFDEDLQFDVIAGGRLESSASDHDPIMVIGVPSRG